MIRKKDNKTYPSKTGKERVQELLEQTSDKSTNLPPSISLRDLDEAVFYLFKSKSGLSDDTRGNLECISPETKKVIDIFSLEKEKWAEFATTYKIQDKNAIPTMPFLTFRRDGAVEKGSHPTLRSTIPANVKFTYTQIYRWDGNELVVDRYKIPQPTPVDIKYEIKLFSHFITDINTMDQNIQTYFDSIQGYVKVKGHYMSVILDGVTSENQIDINVEKFYCNVYKLKLVGFIQDEKDFEKISGLKTIKYDFLLK